MPPKSSRAAHLSTTNVANSAFRLWGEPQLTTSNPELSLRDDDTQHERNATANLMICSKWLTIGTGRVLEETKYGFDTTTFSLDAQKCNVLL